MSIRKIALCTAFAIGLLASAAGVARAQQAVSVVNTPSVNVANTSAVQQQVVNELQNNVVGEIKKLEQINTGLSETMSRTMSNLANSQNQGSYALNVEGARLNALNGAASGPNDCNFLEGGLAFSSYGAQIAQWREQLQDQDLAWLNGDQTVNGQPNPAAAGRYQAFSRLDASSCKLGTAPMSQLQSGECGPYSNYSKSLPDNSQYAGMETNAAKVLNSQNTSPVAQQAATLFEVRAFTPVSLPPLKPIDMAEGSAGATIAQREALSARLSIAAWTAGTIISQYKPDTSDTALTTWATNTAKEMGMAFGGTSADPFPNGVTKNDYMKIVADMPMYDSKFVGALSSITTSPPLLRTLILMQATRNWLAWQQYKMTRQMALNLAAILSQTQEPSAQIGSQ